MKATPTGRDLLLRLPLGPAWASYALIASCILVTLPLFIDPARWSYGLFIAAALYAQWCDQRSRLFRDPVSIAMTFWLVFAFVGLIIRWHLFSVLVSVPFFLAWRKLFQERLHARGYERTPSDRVGIAFFLGVLIFDLVTVAFLLLTAAWCGVMRCRHVGGIDAQVPALQSRFMMAA